MRDQIVCVTGPSGDLEVIVTGEALDVLRAGGQLFQDGASLVRHYRSFITEAALEKSQHDGERSWVVVLDDTDIAG